MLKFGYMALHIFAIISKFIKKDDKMKKLTEQEIRDGVEKAYPKVREFCELVGFTKEQWMEEALDPKPKLKRCENCANWKCDAIKNLEGEWDLFIKIWYEYGCSNCSNFILRTSAPIAKGEVNE